MALVSVGVDHERASLDLLERAGVPEHDWAKVTRALVAQPNVDQAVLVSTCLRTEVVMVVDRFHGAIDEVTAVLAEATGVDPAELEAHRSVHFDRGVVAHLFSVAAGLRSVVPGEYEVLGQLRRALDRALEEGAAARELDDLFRAALSSGRRARSATGLSRGTVSFARAAVDLVAQDADLEGARCVVLGAGQLGAGIARAMLDRPVGRVTILNRTPERAVALAASLADARAGAGGLDELAASLEGARVLVAAVEAPTAVVHAADLARASGLLVVDLALPRAVDASVDALEGVTRRDLGDLSERVARALGSRQEAIAEASEVVARDVERYLDDRRARAAAGIVTELRARVEADAGAELARRSGELARLGDEDRALVEDLVRAVVAKVAHRPTVALREAAGTDRGERLSDAARTLFDL